MLKKSIIAFVALMLNANHIAAAAMATIEVPSNPAIVGVNTVQYLHPEAAASWDALYRPGGYTDQTLANLRGDDSRGIFLLHTLEENLGITPLESTQCFESMWNAEHPDDQRHVSKSGNDEFRKVFKDVFVSHYIPYVLARRYLIASSVLAFNGNPQFTLGQTFGAVGFIIKVPPECIVCAAPCDIGTPVYYATSDEALEDMRHKKSEITEFSAKTLADKRTSLDSLARFPDVSVSEEDSDQYILGMNEVAFLSCGISSSGTVHRPTVVGMFINRSGGDLFYSSYAAECARAQSLPIIYKDCGKDALSLSIPSERINHPQYLIDYMNSKDNFLYFIEGIDRTIIDQTISLCDAEQEIMGDNCNFELLCGSVLQKFPESAPVIEGLKKEITRKMSFLMSPEQLAGYGLR